MLLHLQTPLPVQMIKVQKQIKSKHKTSIEGSQARLADCNCGLESGDSRMMDDMGWMNWNLKF